MLTWLWLDGLVRRRGARVLGVALCVMLEVALVASLGAFISASNARMTAQAISGVPVDWQLELAPRADKAAIRSMVASTHGVKLVREVGYADVAAFVADTGQTVQTTGEGQALGIPDDYATAFPGEIRFLSGSHRGVLLAQQTAANLHVSVGQTIRMQLPDKTMRDLSIDGIIDLPQADSLFQVVGAAPGAGATAPPDNVVLIPMSRWQAIFGPAQASGSSAVRTQFHLELAADLPQTPANAYIEVTDRARNIEAQSAGDVRVGDNLAALLDSARADAIYSELLFLFLGLPGVVLAWLLASVAGAAGRDRRRREQALLRIRGASPRRVVALAVAEALLVGVLGVLLGLVAAVVAGKYVLGMSAAAMSSPTGIGWGLATAALGLALALAAIVVPAQRDARLLTVREARAEVGAIKRPLWERLYADLFLLGGSGLIFWQSMKDAYRVVLVPEGVPTISINYLTLLAPMMFWVGFALLVWRLSDLTLRRGVGLLKGISRMFAGNLSGVVASSMSRQRTLLARSLVLVALAISFAVSVAIFNTTYTNQARVDAELTNGADVSVISEGDGLPDELPSRVQALSGVTAVERMEHRLAYVGNDLQDLYGIDPKTIGRATPMSDAYFPGSTAAEALGKLTSTEDGVLVSDETVHDFQLQMGDQLRIRMQGPDNAYHVVPFRFVGVARVFPTAPRDSFLVANAAYVAKKTGVADYETLLIKTSVSPKAMAGRVRGLVDTSSGVSVHDLESELKTTLSGLTAIDLSGLTRLELLFAVFTAVAASGMMLALGFAERRRTFAIAQALGAKGGQLASFVWAEALFAATGGAALGATGGAIEAYIIVKILTGVFDPPPDSLAVPWGYLGVVALAMAVSVGLAATLAVHAARRPALEVIRDL